MVNALDDANKDSTAQYKWVKAISSHPSHPSYISFLSCS